ncbi:adenine phosphoribosyltransferase [Sphingobium jiangsuense]|uniref:Adenine phosphoribosyltransferase n=1 Tax=Sphingobium jiangsuense TaxID=870476 RepID=A0A7W6BMT0_9SPHN|nr:adenine phosphoribosyltransferase [Sphingobium jiangsuense]MBB3925493.1 adenine phosphoribosyltransferase [Sphingobium jiangsuense]GLS99914.1 adenine phosphoribosyltransferase [Sphingobium jiangsuense]
MTDPDANADLAVLVRSIPDHPRPGILFRDLSTLLLDGWGFRTAIDRLIATLDAGRVDLIAGIEARGFIVASALSYALTKGKIMLRKSGKLPGEAVGIDYALEYGTDRIEMHVDAVRPGTRVLLVDDLIATGGTALAGVSLLRGQGAVVEEARFLVDLPALGGADRLAAQGVACRSLLAFPGH